MQNSERRVHVLQPALAAYRIDFYSRVARKLGARFRVFYSPTDMGAITAGDGAHDWQEAIGPVRPILPGLTWQSGALGLPIKRGDTLVITGEPRCLSNLLLLLRARLLGVRTIWCGHYWSSTTKRWRFVLRMILMRLADAVLFYTDAEVAEYNAGQSKQRRRPVSALSNGIDTETIKGHRQPYSADQRPAALLFIGRLTEKTGLGLLFEALADPKLAQVELHIIGSGLGEAALRTQADRLALGTRLHWHGGTTDEAQIAEVANKTALFVYPGAVGLSLIHAMAYGLPAIVHNNRWKHMPEIAAFEDGETGRVFIMDDAQSLAESLANALSDIGARDRWSQASIQRTTMAYNTVVMAQRFCEMIDRLENGRASPGA